MVGTSEALTIASQNFFGSGLGRIVVIVAICVIALVIYLQKKDR